MKRQLWRNLRKASPLILTLMSVAGVVGTAVVTAINTPKAQVRVQEKEAQLGPLKPIEKAIAAAPAYLPAVGVGFATITCIFGANYLNHRQNLSLAATCTLLQKTLSEYKGKVKEAFGVEADRDIRKQIARTKYDPDKVKKPKHPKSEELYLYFEENSQEWFWATEAEVIHAEMEVNRLVTEEGSCSLMEYCHLLGIEPPEGSENLGWAYQDFVENWDTHWIYFEHEFISDPDADMPPYWHIHTQISPEWVYELEGRVEYNRLYIDDDGCYAYDVR